MKAALFKMPLLGTVCKCVGHFPVYFTSDEDGVFKVDPERMKAVEENVDKHLHNGGWLCFFPEGCVNKNPDKLLPLRHGSFKRAIEFDAKLASFVAHGNWTVWPVKASVGGLPGSVRYSTKVLAPNGAKAMAAELRKKAEEEAK